MGARMNEVSRLIINVITFEVTQSIIMTTVTRVLDVTDNVSVAIHFALQASRFKK